MPNANAVFYALKYRDGSGFRAEDPNDEHPKPWIFADEQECKSWADDMVECVR